MSNKNPKNISASVRARLLNRAKLDKRPFEEILQYYAMERFLYRLSVSSHASRFILKGALMFKVWELSLQRPTMDIDMLGITSNEEEHIVAQIKDILSVSVISDGIVFDPTSIKTSRILEDADYEGIKVTFQGNLGITKIYIQIDIGFGDIVFPQPEKANLPTLLDFPAPTLLCYSMESVIAEKFDAMVSRGMTNSRVKDFYDIWLLSRQYKFESHKLAEAIRLTFGQRHTELPREILAFSQEFIEEKQTQWTTFRNKLGQEHIPKSFQDIVNTIEMFLTPVIFSLPHKKSTPTLLEIKEQLKLAISQHLKVEIYYKDDMQNRLVNPYHYGNLGGADHLHAFQVSGNSKSNTPTGWKNFLISDISNLKVTANNFLAPDDGYNPRAPDYLVEHKIHYDIKQKSKSQLESLEETV